MDISKTICPDCKSPMQLTRATCTECDVSLEGTFEISPLARLTEEDQIFVMAFLRHHGSIRKMEKLFEISYPTVKNRLRSLVAQLDEIFEVPGSEPTANNALVLEQLAQGELTVDEALERME